MAQLLVCFKICIYWGEIWFEPQKILAVQIRIFLYLFKCDVCLQTSCPEYFLQIWESKFIAFLLFWTSSVKYAEKLKSAPKESLAFTYFRKLRKKLQVNIQWNVLLSDNAKKTKHQGFSGKSCKLKLTEVWHFFMIIALAWILVELRKPLWNCNPTQQWCH